MNVFVIILHFGDIKVTKDCITSLQKNDKFPKKIVVVNNTTENIKKNLPKSLVVINNKKNLGFAKGVNEGIAYALKQKATHVVLLNNDTTITKPLVKNLLDVMRTTNAGIIGPAILFKKQNKKVYDIGGKISTLFWRTTHNEVSRLTDITSRTVDYVSGCCMLINASVIKKIGFLDEHFFLYYEDADFCIRAKDAGFSVVLDEKTVIHHALSASKGKTSPFTIYHLLRSGIYFGRKYAKGFVQKTANKLFILFQAGLFLRASPLSAAAIARALLR